MTTGPVWDTSDPKKPFAEFDPDAIRVIPFSVVDLLASMGTTYASHQVIVATPLECVSSQHASGVIAIKMKLATGASFKQGTKYPFTVRVVGADGQQDDRTLRLLVKDR